MSFAALALLWASAGAPVELPREDAWKTVASASALLEGVPRAPLIAWIWSEPHKAPPLLEEDLRASLPAARAAQRALAHLDAAHVQTRCFLPRPFDGAPALALTDHALLAALVDGSGGDPSRAGAGLLRAAQMASLLSRCSGQTIGTLETQRLIAARTRAVARFMAEQRLIGAPQLARVAHSLASAWTPSSFERAVEGEHRRLGRPFTLREQERVAALDAALGRDLEDQRALEHDADNYETMERPVHRVVLACAAGATPQSFTMARAAAAALERRGPEALMADSVAVPDVEGNIGFVVVAAGPLARSCGFQDGDVIVGVNDVELRMLDDSLARAERHLRRERYAVFRVRRAGSLLSWRIDIAPR